MKRLYIKRIDETTTCRTRGIRVGWRRWADDCPPWHYGHRWFQAHFITWSRKPDHPALKVQIEIKTYKTEGMRSVDGSKRYVRFGVCL